MDRLFDFILWYSFRSWSRIGNKMGSEPSLAAGSSYWVSTPGAVEAIVSGEVKYS